MSDDKIYVADKRMQKFFQNLLALKSFVKEAAESSRDPLLHEIHEKLDKIIKEGK
jgi:hypothetical protein